MDPGLKLESSRKSDCSDSVTLVHGNHLISTVTQRSLCSDRTAIGWTIHNKGFKVHRTLRQLSLDFTIQPQKTVETFCYMGH